jgi:hypothetical protein
MSERAEAQHTLDINQILNDVSLNNELLSLGWVDSTPAPAPTAIAPRAASVPPPPAPVYVAAPTAPARVDIPDISGIGMIDEHKMALTEDDLQDSSLLAEFEEMQSGDAGAWPAEGAAVTVDSVPALPVPAPAPSPPTPAPAPAPAAPTRAPSQPISFGPGIPTAAEAKQQALRFKREGNNTDALKWLRYAKQIESGIVGAVPGEAAVSAAQPIIQPYIQTVPRPVSFRQASSKALALARAPAPALRAPAPAPAPAPTAEAFEVSWAALEAALAEATKYALKEAKFLNDAGDKKMAVVRMREYKALQQESAVLQARRYAAGAVPALFHWEVSAG